MLRWGAPATADGCAVALLTAGKFHPRPGEKVCALICGAGADGLD